MNLLAVPVLVMFAAAALAAILAAPAFARGPLRHAPHAVALAAFAISGFAAWQMLGEVSRGRVLTLHFGSWPAGIAIAFVADRLTVLMLGVTAAVGAACHIYGMGFPGRREVSQVQTALTMVMFAGVNGCYLTGDFFNLFVFFEIMLIGSYGLLALRAGREQLRGTFVYLVLNLMASTLLLVSVGLLYGHLGTVNMAFVSQKLAMLAAGPGVPPAVTAALASVLGVFVIKAAAFPFGFWLPEAYPRAWAPMGAAMAGLLTKVGVYCLFRGLPLVSPGIPWAADALLVLAGLSMFFGVAGAMAQNGIRRILSFHIISQIGYMIFGIALFNPLGVAGGLFYILHHVLVKTNLFLVGGAVEARFGEANIKKLSGLARLSPGMAAGFFLAAFSLAGVPPLSGFYGKLALLASSLSAGQYMLAGVSLLTSLLTLFSMVKIWNGAFWGPKMDVPAGRVPAQDWRLMGAGVLLLTLCSLAVAAFAGPAFAYMQDAAAQILNPSAYVEAVLGGGAPS